MTPIELIANLALLKRTLLDVMINVTIARALEGKAFIQERIQEGGTNWDGRDLESIHEYSDGYLSHKKKKGYYRGKVDFTYRDLMWADINVIEYKSNEGEHYAVIGGLGETTKTKMKHLNKYWSDWFNLSDAEKLKLQLSFEQEISRYVKKLFT
jgi:hypothetical protein